MASANVERRWIDKVDFVTDEIFVEIAMPKIARRIMFIRYEAAFDANLNFVAVCKSARLPKLYSTRRAPIRPTPTTSRQRPASQQNSTPHERASVSV